MNIVFRTDASSEIGTGHVMRCVTLANKLRENRTTCTFICRDHIGNLVNYIKEQGFTVHVLPLAETSPIDNDLDHAHWLGCSRDTDAKETKKILNSIKPEWLVVDHYALDITWEKPLKDFYKKLMVIDDLADRSHCCDLLLDQNLICPEKSPYLDLVPKRCKQLLGPKYAMLREEFNSTRPSVGQVKQIERIFVYFGSVDDGNLTELFIKALESEELKKISAHVVVGINNIHAKTIAEAAATNENIRLHFGVQTIAELMANSDIALGTGGSSTWERMCMGLPSLVVVGGDNEQQIANELAAQGLIEVLGSVSEITPSLFKSKIMECIHNIDRIQKQQKHMLQVVDGIGIERVVDQLR